MCSVSMIMDHFSSEWTSRLQEGPAIYQTPAVYKFEPPLITQTELDSFQRLIERAKEYDRQTGQPDCELEEKRQKLIALAKELGATITF